MNNPDLPKDQILVLFDGHCNLCNGAVQFILKRDRRERFVFAALTWPAGETVKALHPEIAGTDSIVVYHKERVYVHSSAALYIAERLDGLWPVLAVFWVVPPFIRNAVYRWVARNRYRWFGRKDTCMIPDRDLSHRFLNA